MNGFKWLTTNALQKGMILICFLKHKKVEASLISGNEMLPNATVENIILQVSPSMSLEINVLSWLDCIIEQILPREGAAKYNKGPNCIIALLYGL